MVKEEEKRCRQDVNQKLEKSLILMNEDKSKKPDETEAKKNFFFEKNQ